MKAMDIFKQEFVRPLLTLVVPGTIMSGPYLAVMFYYQPTWLEFMISNVNLAVIIFLVESFAVGLVADDFGALVEAKIWDKRLKKANPDHMKTWDEYLAIEENEKLVANGYLSHVLLNMKFELNTALALIVALPGACWLQSVTSFMTGCSFSIIIIISFLLIVYLLWESYNSAKLLGKVRSIIVKVSKP